MTTAILAALVVALVIVLAVILARCRTLRGQVTQCEIQLSKHRETIANCSLGAEHADRTIDRLQSEIANFPAQIKAAREDAAKRSRIGHTARAIEALAPHLAEFEWSPTDARFLGGVADYLVLDGLHEDADDVSVIFVEVKSGQSGRLSKRQLKVKRAIEANRVTWRTIHI